MAEPDGWVRLHPLSPFLFAARFVLVALFLTLQVWADRSAESAPAVNVVVAVGVALVGGGLAALAYAAIAWRFRLYRVTADMVELKTGILFRSYRHVPFERIESVDTARPLVPRLLGLAEVRVEAISKQGSELKLRYLSVDAAERLRVELSTRRRSRSADAHDAVDAASPILQVPARELVVAYVVIPLLNGAGVVLPVALVAGLAGGASAAVAVLMFGLLGAIVSLLPLLLRLEAVWDFRLADAGDALVINRGLLNLDTQRILTGRVQALRIDQPLLWRPYKRFRVVVDVAGYRGAGNEAAAAAANLLPIAPRDVVRYVVGRLEIRADLDALLYDRVPTRARWRSLRWRSFKVAWTDTHAVIGSGVLWRRMAVVPLKRIQSVRVTQGPWQRRLRLATVSLDTAGSRINAEAAHRDVHDAVRLADESSRRARELDSL